MTRLSDFPIGDLEEVTGGVLHRNVFETFQAECLECKKIVTAWTNYNDAVAEYIQHRYEEHHAPRNRYQ